MNLAWWANESFLNVSWIKYERIERQTQSILHIPRCSKISEKSIWQMLENVYTVSCKNKGVPVIRSAFRRFPISYIHFSAESPISRGFLLWMKRIVQTFEIFDEKSEEFHKYSCLNCIRNWFEIDSKTDKMYNKGTYFVRKFAL